MNKLKTSRLALMLAIILFTAILTGCQKDESTLYDYLILYAFPAEGEYLALQMEIENRERIQGRTVLTGELAGKSIILAESGMGMTNAAMTTQKMIDKYRPLSVIFSGIAGAVDEQVGIGDIVVCSTWVTHDYGYYGSEGFIPGAIHAYDPSVDSLAMINNFHVDSSLFALAKNLKSQNLPLQKIGDRTPRLITGGIGVSGDAFIDQVAKRQWLAETFDALITDMESAAVAQVCIANKIPFIVFRSASDLAGGSGSESAQQQLQQFFEVAAENSAKIVVNLLESI